MTAAILRVIRGYRALPPVVTPDSRGPCRPTWVATLRREHAGHSLVGIDFAACEASGAARSRSLPGASAGALLVAGCLGPSTSRWPGERRCGPCLDQLGARGAGRRSTCRSWSAPGAHRRWSVPAPARPYPVRDSCATWLGGPWPLSRRHRARPGCWAATWKLGPVGSRRLSGARLYRLLPRSFGAAGGDRRRHLWIRNPQLLAGQTYRRHNSSSATPRPWTSPARRGLLVTGCGLSLTRAGPVARSPTQIWSPESGEKTGR